MMNDIRALCSVNDPGLVQFIGAYHAPENGQVPCATPLSRWIMLSGFFLTVCLPALVIQLRRLMLSRCMHDDEWLRSVCSPTREWQHTYY